MDQPFRTRDESRARVKKEILALPFKKNDSGNYNYADAQIFIKQVAREFERQHNEFTTDGMKGLTGRDTNNKLLALKSNRAIKWQDVIKASKAAAKARNQGSGKDGDEVPDIDNTPDAREEADRQNITRFSAVG